MDIYYHAKNIRLIDFPWNKLINDDITHPEITKHGIIALNIEKRTAIKTHLRIILQERKKQTNYYKCFQIFM
jgi:hypothetical protein